MPRFAFTAGFSPAGGQPEAIRKLAEGVEKGRKHQVLLGVTGSGKTMVVAEMIQEIQRPTLVMSPNKTLAAQLCSEFRTFFPENSVEYFVSYYDYYQPEAYIPRSDTYIEKDSSRNDEVERMVQLDPLTGELVGDLEVFQVFAATHYVTPRQKLLRALDAIGEELDERVAWFESQGKLLEAQRLRQRTLFDMELMRETG